MTVSSWPAELPACFTNDSYAEQGPENVLFSDVSIGPSKARRRTTAQTWSMSGTMVMSASQYQAFLVFLRTVIGDGARTFLFPDRLGGSPLLVRISGSYKAARSGAKWHVTFSLDVMP